MDTPTENSPNEALLQLLKSLDLHHHPNNTETNNNNTGGDVLSMDDHHNHTNNSPNMNHNNNINNNVILTGWDEKVNHLSREESSALLSLLINRLNSNHNTTNQNNNNNNDTESAEEDFLTAPHLNPNNTPNHNHNSNAGKRNVYIRNIPKSWNTNKLKKMCGCFGNIISAKISYHARSNTSLGYGFILFEREEEAQQCIERLNAGEIAYKEVSEEHPEETVIKQVKLVASLSKEKSVPVYQGNSNNNNHHPAPAQHPQQRSTEEGGDLSPSHNNHNGSGTPHTASTVNVCPRCNVYFTNIPKSWNTNKLREICSCFGNIISAKISYHARSNTSLGYGFILFEREEEAQQCIERLNGAFVKDENTVLNCRLAMSKALPNIVVYNNTNQNQNHTGLLSVQQINSETHHSVSSLSPSAFTLTPVSHGATPYEASRPGESMHYENHRTNNNNNNSNPHNANPPLPQPPAQQTVCIPSVVVREFKSQIRKYYKENVSQDFIQRSLNASQNSNPNNNNMNSNSNRHFMNFFSFSSDSSDLNTHNNNNNNPNNEDNFILLSMDDELNTWCSQCTVMGAHLTEDTVELLNNILKRQQQQPGGGNNNNNNDLISVFHTKVLHSVCYGFIIFKKSEYADRFLFENNQNNNLLRQHGQLQRVQNLFDFPPNIITEDAEPLADNNNNNNRSIHPNNNNNGSYNNISVENMNSSNHTNLQYTPAGTSTHNSNNNKVLDSPFVNFYTVQHVQSNHNTNINTISNNNNNNSGFTSSAVVNPLNPSMSHTVPYPYPNNSNSSVNNNNFSYPTLPSLYSPAVFSVPVPFLNVNAIQGTLNTNNTSGSYSNGTPVHGLTNFIPTLIAESPSAMSINTYYNNSNNNNIHHPNNNNNNNSMKYPQEYFMTAHHADPSSLGQRNSASINNGSVLSASKHFSFNDCNLK